MPGMTPWRFGYGENARCACRLFSASAVRCVAGVDKLRAGRFIKQTQDTFKSGGQKAELLPLLERCTRELQSNDRYKNDIRYLRVWIQYVSQLPLHNHLPASYKTGQERCLS